MDEHPFKTQSIPASHILIHFSELDALGDEMFEDELNVDDAISAPTGPLSEGGEANTAQVSNCINLLWDWIYRSIKGEYYPNFRLWVPP